MEEGKKRTGCERSPSSFLEDEAARRQRLGDKAEYADGEEEAEEARREAEDGRRVEY